MDSPLKGEDLAYFVDNSSPYTYLDRGSEILITPTPNTLTNVMKLFLDTAIVSDIEERLDTGLIAGVTTNPTLIRKSGRAVSYTHLTLPTSDLV